MIVHARSLSVGFVIGIGTTILLKGLFQSSVEYALIGALLVVTPLVESVIVPLWKQRRAQRNERAAENTDTGS